MVVVQNNRIIKKSEKGREKKALKSRGNDIFHHFSKSSNVFFSFFFIYFLVFFLYKQILTTKSGLCTLFAFSTSNDLILNRKGRCKQMKRYDGEE